MRLIEQFCLHLSIFIGNFPFVCSFSSCVDAICVCHCIESYARIKRPGNINGYFFLIEFVILKMDTVQMLKLRNDYISFSAMKLNHKIKNIRIYFDQCKSMIFSYRFLFTQLFKMVIVLVNRLNKYTFISCENFFSDFFFLSFFVHELILVGKQKIKFVSFRRISIVHDTLYAYITMTSN